MTGHRKSDSLSTDSLGVKNREKGHIDETIFGRKGFRILIQTEVPWVLKKENYLFLVGC